MWAPHLKLKHLHHLRSMAIGSFSRKSSYLTWCNGHADILPPSRWVPDQKFLTTHILNGYYLDGYNVEHRDNSKMKVTWQPLQSFLSSGLSASQTCSNIVSKSRILNKVFEMSTNPQWVVVICAGDLVKLTCHSVVEDRLTSEGIRTNNLIWLIQVQSISENRPPAYFWSAEVAKKSLSIL